MGDESPSTTNGDSGSGGRRHGSHLSSTTSFDKEANVLIKLRNTKLLSICLLPSTPSSAAVSLINFEQPKMLLGSGCGSCGTKDKLLTCTGCRVVHYCSREHQLAHRSEHKHSCNAIKKARAQMEIQDKALSNHPGSSFTPKEVFINAIGQYWGTIEMDAYVEALTGYVEALSQIQVRASCKLQLSLLLKLINFCRSIRYGTRNAIPALMLRLNMDQECYDFLKWWGTMGQDPGYDFASMTLPYLHIKDANALEDAGDFLRIDNLSDTVSMLLLKIKLMWVLLTKDNDALAEMLEVKDSSFRQSSYIVNCQDPVAEIQNIKDHIDMLYCAIGADNIYFFAALLQPNNVLFAGPPTGFARPGSPEDMRVTIRATYDAWNETFGALEVIKRKVRLDFEPYH